MENIGKCVDNFSKGPLAEYIKTQTELSTLCRSLNEMVKAGPAEFKVAAREAVPLMDSILGSAKTYEDAGKSFIGEIKACTNSMKAVVELFRSAKNIL